MLQTARLNSEEEIDTRVDHTIWENGPHTFSGTIRELDLEGEELGVLRELAANNVNRSHKHQYNESMLEQ